MPELPEVETIRRDLERRLVGARIVSVWTSGKPLHLNRPIDVAGLRAAGGRILALRRHGKYLYIDAERGTVIIHLGMTGNLVVAARGKAPPHTHVVWRLSDRRELRYIDARRFGRVGTVVPVDTGIDPFERGFTAARLAGLLQGSKRALKLFLLDQSKIAGIGNIYASEAMWEAKIHPDRPADRVRGAEIAALWRAIRAVLRRAIRNRGTTLRDYRDGDGNEGENQNRLRVYGREHRVCYRCGGEIRRTVHQGRATYFCPDCQIR